MPNSTHSPVPELVTPWGPVGYLTYKRCVDEATPILCADMLWRPAGSLMAGDEILAFDESPRKRGSIYQRYLKTAKVISNASEEAECVGVEIDTGEVLFCTPDHSWLVKMSGNTLEWRNAADLEETKFGGPVYLPRVFGKPWERGETYADGYLAGAFDGEGSVDRTNSIIFTQVNNSMLARVTSSLEGRGVRWGKKEKSLVSATEYKRPRQPCFDVKVYGIKQIVRLLGEVGSSRLLEKLLLNLKKKPQLMRCDPSDYCRVIRVFPAGKRRVAVLETESKTHFTDGFPSHNTYARRLSEASSVTEEFPQMVRRVLGATQNQLGCGFAAAELVELERYLLTLKCSAAGRFNWQLGTKTVDDYGLMSLQNCAVVAVNEPIRPFTWAFDALMLGCGVGFNIQREYVYELPKVRALRKPVVRQDTKDADFIIPDSREGWVEVLDRVLRSYFETGKGFSYSPILVRGKGAVISRFGGVASGPEILCEGIQNICSVLDRREGKKIRPIDALDVMCIIGAIVVSGNVRRSALLAMGDPDDFQYLNAKRWDLGDIPNWRAMSNNSVVCNNINDLPDQFWKGYQGNGEPYGLVNLKLSRSCGRVGDTQYKDPGIVGYNPCAEQGLNQYETCCLAETFLPNVESPQELTKITQYLYRICKHSLTLPCHHEETEAIVHKNMRMGIGQTGYLQARKEQRDWLAKAYDDLREYDRHYSAERGFPVSVKLTTCKPSGTLSLLPGVTPGVHPGIFQYFLRRIQIASNSDLVSLVREHGHHIEYRKNFDGTDDHTTVVAEFPCSYPEGTILATDTSAIQQLEHVQQLQRDWSDNAVSCTVYYKPEELPEIREWLKKHYNSTIKSVSFLLHQGHGFVQAPYEEISKAEYEKLVRKVKPIVSASFNGDDVNDTEAECQSGACPVR